MHNFFKSSFYFDFLIKKISESFVRNVSVYTAIFFCEKFIVEFLTKVVAERYTRSLVNRVSGFNFFFESLACQFLLVTFYFLALSFTIILIC